MFAFRMPAYRYHPHVLPSPASQRDVQSAMEQYDVFESSETANGSLLSQYDDSVSSSYPDRAGYSMLPSFAPHSRRWSYENSNQVGIFEPLLCISFIPGHRRDVATMAKDTSTAQRNHDAITKIPGTCNNQRECILIPWFHC